MNAKKATISSVALNNNFIWVVWYGSVLPDGSAKLFYTGCTQHPSFFFDKNSYLKLTT